MEKFKKGDLVKVNGSGYDGCSLIGTEQVIDSAGQDGYRFVGDDHEACHIRDEHLTLIRRANMFKKGDILENDDLTHTLEVLETLGEVIFTRDSDDYATRLWCAEELENAGWKLKTETETKELTIDEIADKFGLKPEQVHIKKGD